MRRWLMLPRRASGTEWTRRGLLMAGVTVGWFDLVLSTLGIPSGLETLGERPHALLHLLLLGVGLGTLLGVGCATLLPERTRAWDRWLQTRWLGSTRGRWCVRGLVLGVSGAWGWALHRHLLPASLGTAGTLAAGVRETLRFWCGTTWPVQVPAWALLATQVVVARWVAVRVDRVLLALPAQTTLTETDAPHAD